MRGTGRGRVSPAMVVATVALIAALGQTAVALPIAQLARLVGGDTLIKKGSLSGNRLRKHTLTGTQINLAKLGTVPAARFATNSTNASHASSADSAANSTNAIHAGSADNATNASNATRADTAGDANTLQGNPASAFVHGNGQVISGRLDLANGTPETPVITIPGVGTMNTSCLSGAGELVFRNTSGNTEDVSSSVDYSPPTVIAVPTGSTEGVLGISSGHTDNFQVATRTGSPEIVTIAATYTTAASATCTAFAQATTGS
jgi:hypothetical protein